MKRRLSISRLMVAIGLIGLSLTLLRSWIGPKNFFGFLGLMGWMVLSFWIAAFVTTESVRRFFTCVGMIGSSLLVAVFVAPAMILDFTWARFIFPVIRTFASASDLNHYQYQWYWVETMLRPDSRFDQGFRGWFQIRSTVGIGFPDTQLLLLFPYIAISLISGWIATLVLPRPERSSVRIIGDLSSHE